MTYNDTFRDRADRSLDAKKALLEKLKAAPKPSEAELAERKAARLKKEAEEAEARAAKKAAIEQAKAEKLAAEAEAKAEADAAAQAAKDKMARSFMLPTSDEAKAARDARYAARKARQR